MIRKITLPVLLLLLFSCEKTVDTEILRFYGDSAENIGYSITTAENGYLIAGQYTKLIRNSDGNWESLKKLVLVRTDINGIEEDTLTGEIASCAAKIISLDDGSAVIAGFATSQVTQKDIYIVKVAPGNEGYTEKIFQMTGNQYANDIIKVPGGYLVLGTTDVERGASDDTGNAKGKKDILFLSINDNLDIIRSIPYGFIGDDEGMTLKAGPDGMYIIVGTTDRYNATNGKDIFILTANPDISTTSIRYIGGRNDESAADFELTKDGYFIAGKAGPEGSQTGHVWKIEGDILGTITDHPISVGSKYYTVSSICAYKTNSFLMAGQYGSLTSGSMLIFATDMFGYPIEGKVKITGGTGNQVAYDVISEGEDVIAVGKNSYENSSKISFLKFRF